MRGEKRLALKLLIRAALVAGCAGLSACTTLPADSPQAQTPTPAAGLVPVTTANPAAHAVPPIGPAAYAPPPASVSYPRYGDSDDYLCNFAPPRDPRTPAACLRLRGPDAVPQPPAHYGDTDDFVCNHGTPGEPRTTQACLRLHAPEP